MVGSRVFRGREPGVCAWRRRVRTRVDYFLSSHCQVCVATRVVSCGSGVIPLPPFERVPAEHVSFSPLRACVCEALVTRQHGSCGAH